MGTFSDLKQKPRLYGRCWPGATQRGMIGHIWQLQFSFGSKFSAMRSRLYLRQHNAREGSGVSNEDRQLEQMGKCRLLVCRAARGFGRQSASREPRMAKRHQKILPQ